jgi:DNA-binding SARP family transcriptional activator/energy-coupling factor transporter ATP-binding protein EcfA2
MGAVDVYLDDRAVHLTGMQRSLFAMLALGGGQVLSVSQLAAGLWEADGPTAAPARIRMLVSELRRVMPGIELIVTTSPGYRIAPGPIELDSSTFASAIDDARAARVDGRLSDSARLYTEALDIWRGPALGGAAPGPFVNGQVNRLEDARLSAIEERAEVDLELGRHDSVVAAMDVVSSQHPTRDRAHYLVMLAHYRSGRAGDALRVYRSARDRYRDELGLEPGSELGELHLRILRADPTLLIRGDGSRLDNTRPAELPPDLGDFTGRWTEVAAACAALVGETAVPVVALYGRPGVGKSTLAVHVAHLLRPQYPDGQLYIDLGAAGNHPAEPYEVLGRFLNALGLPGQSIPQDREARVSLYRSRLADRRVLMMLDDAVSAAQIRPLLPGVAGCAVLVTSRSPLAAPLGARALLVDVLDPAASRDLVATIIGSQRAWAERGAVDRLVALCGQLPLALRVAAGRLAESPHWRIATLVARLSDESHRLDELQHGGVDIRATLQMGHRALSPSAAIGLRRLGMLPPGDFAPWVAAALVDMSLSDAGPVIDELIRAGFLDYCGHDRTGEARYRLHDLIRAYAIGLANNAEVAERVAAEQRLYAAWLAGVREAATGLPCRPLVELAGPGAACPVPGYFTGEAIAWFETERAGLLAIVRRAAEHGNGYAYQIASSAAKFFELRGYFDDWRMLYQCGLDAAVARADLSSQAYLRCGLAAVDRFQDRHDEARRGYEAGHAYFAKAGDELGAAIADAGRAVVLRMLGQVEASVTLSLAAIAAFTAHGDTLRAAQTRYSTAVTRYDQQEWREVVTLLEQALPALQTAGDRETECRAWGVLGMVHLRQGRHDEAMRYLERSVALTGELGLVIDGAYARVALSELHAAQGRIDLAREMVELSLRVIRASGDRNGEIRMLNRLAHMLASQQRSDEALSAAEQAAELSAIVGNPHLQAQQRALVAELRESTGVHEMPPEWRVIASA